MELGARLRQARLEAGLSQRQLCGEEITRNMLSLIENGSAQPSMDTLRYLSARLGKPVSYFLDEQPLSSPNQSCMEQARNAPAEAVLQILEQYRPDDPIFDRERYLLEALSCMELAEQAICQQKLPYGAVLLEQAAEAGSKTPYYTPELERRRLLLYHAAHGSDAKAIAAALPDMTPELLLRAEAALESKNPQHCAALLEAVQDRSPRWHYLRAEAYFLQENYADAADHYLLSGDFDPQRSDRALEICYREMGDYKKAYYYACKQR